MEEKGISQLPVLAGDETKGVVSEKELLKPVLEGEYQLTDSVSLVLGKVILNQSTRMNFSQRLQTF